MSIEEHHVVIVNQVAKRFGNVIDLQETPGVLIEILRTFGHVLDEDGGGGGGGVSSIAVAGAEQERVQLEELMRAILDLRKEVRNLGNEVKGLHSGPVG